MNDANKFANEIAQLDAALKKAKRVLITAPGTADGDSVGSQLALYFIFRHAYPNLQVCIVNDEPIPERYLFLPAVEKVCTPETFPLQDQPFDVGIIVDGGIDRAGRVRPIFQKCATTAFIDHHSVSVQYPYTIRIVESNASSTTELIFHLSRAPEFSNPVDKDFAQVVYLGLIFDTGFFRHSNTTPQAMELGAKLLRTGFDFTRVGERGMMIRTFSSLQLLAYTLSRAQLRGNGKIIWSALTQQTLNTFGAENDDREGIIDHLYLTSGIEVAVLFFELPGGKTKVSFRSQGSLDVAKFARSLTEHGGGHAKAAGANLDQPVARAADQILQRLEEALAKVA